MNRPDRAALGDTIRERDGRITRGRRALATYDGAELDVGRRSFRIDIADGQPGAVVPIRVLETDVVVFTAHVMSPCTSAAGDALMRVRLYLARSMRR